MNIHIKSVDMDMDMDVKFHIHGNPGFGPWFVEEEDTPDFGHALSNRI